MKRAFHSVGGWKGRLILAGATVVALAIGLVAFAYFTSTGTGAGSANAGTLSAPTITSATPGGSTVALNWSTVAPPAGAGGVTYYVTRDGGDPGGDCPPSSSAANVTSCTDSGLAAGTYSYTVTAKWHSWTATGAAVTATVVSGAATHLVLAAATTTPASGAADDLTITAKDASNSTVTGYTGDKSLTFSGASPIGSFNPTVTDKNGTAVDFGTAETITFTNGVAAVSGSSNGVMKLYKAESPTITVTDGSISNTGLSVTVAAAAASVLVFSTQPGSATAGSVFVQQPVVRTQDAFGNDSASGLGVARDVSVAVASGTGLLQGTATLDIGTGAGNGTVTFTNLRIDAAGAKTLSATAAAGSPALSAATSGSFTVAAGTATQMVFTTQTTGVANASATAVFPVQPVVTVQDGFGNTATSYATNVSLAISAGTLTCTSTSVTPSSGVATFAACHGSAFGTGITLTASSGSLTPKVSNSFNITTAATKVVFSTQPSSSATAGSAFAQQPVVSVQDASSRTVTVSSASVALAITGGTGTAGAALTCTANSVAASLGVATFSACSIDKSGSGYTLTATSSGLTSAVSSPSTTISSGAATKLSFTAQPSGCTDATVCTTQPVVTIQDALGNTVTTATSSIALAINTGSGALACTANPKAAVAGVATFAGCKITLGTAGAFTLSATFAGLTTDVSTSFTVFGVETPLATGNWNAVDTWTAVTRSGTITSATNSTTVTGTGTFFQTELVVGDRLLRSDGTTSIGVVQSIQSDTSLTLTANASTANTNAAYTNRSIPTTDDDVSITTAITITIPSGYAAVANSLTFGSSANTLLPVLTFAAGSSSLTTSGDVTMSAPSAGATRDLAVNAGTLTVGGNLSLSAGASGNQNNRINKVTITTGTVTVSGDLVFNAGNFLSVNALQNQIIMSGGAATFNLAGAFTLNNGGGTSSGTVTPGTTSTFNFNGSVAQTIPIGVSSIVYNNLKVNNTSASGATPGAAITGTNVTGNVTVETGTLDNSGNAITLASTKLFAVQNSATFKLSGTSTMVTVSGGGTKTFGATSTVDYAGAAQTVTNETYGHLSLSGSSTKTMPNTAMTVAGNFSMSGTTTATALANLIVNGNVSLGGTAFTAGAFSHQVKGNFSNSGTFTSTGSTFTFNGSSQQTLSGSGLSFNAVTLSNSAGMLLSGADMTVGGTLTFTLGNITTGANKVIASGGVSRTSGFVNGNLQKPFAIATSSPTFEIGTGTTYAPISLASLVVTVAGNLTAASTEGLHSSFGTSGISGTKYVNRYWTLTAGGGLTATSFTGTFTFVAGDLVGGPNTAALIVRRFVSPSTWTAGTSPSSTVTTVTGGFTTSFGDFAAGE